MIGRRGSLVQVQRSGFRLLAGIDSLILRLIQGVDLGSTVGAFDFDMLKGHVDQVLAALAALILPPEEAATDHHYQHQ
ncbi:hypothetical protein D9M71_740110 [compost metagenome]